MIVLLDMLCTVLFPLSAAVHHHWSSAMLLKTGFFVGVLQGKFLFAWQVDRTAIFTSYFTLNISTRYFSELLILVSDRIYQLTFLQIDSRHSKITHGKLCSYEQLFWKIQSSQLSQFHHVPLTGLPYWLITIEKVQLINSESNLQSLQHPKSRAVFFSTLGNRKSC